MVQLRKRKDGSEVDPSKLSWKLIKQKVRQYIDESDDRESAQIRAKFLDRWAELSGLERDENGTYDYNLIDHENKWVKLEWYMCDRNIFFKLVNDKTRAEGVMMLPEDCRATYYEVGPGNDKPYSEVRMGASAIKQYINKKRGKE